LLIALVGLAAVAIFALMPSQPGFVDVKVGAGPAAVAGDTLDVHYVGRLGGTRLSDWLRLGKEFDNSRVRNVPFTFPVGQGQVIRGWDLGMLGMRAGGVRKIVIPPAYAYGAKGVPPVIPPNSTLIFEVELLRILPKPGQGNPKPAAMH
jgi:FKBP-type peptidyl-prolyl cis-trans isomerase